METQKNFWNRICSEEIFYLAWQKVKANRGCPGIDRISISDFEINLHKNLTFLRNLVIQGLYEPLPLVEREIKKDEGKKRMLKIPTIKDRIVQEAVLIVIQPEFEKIFLNCSYGYRHRKSALMAVSKIETLIREGYHWIAEADIKDFFDTVSKKLVIALFADIIQDSRIVNLTKKWILYDSSPSIGIPQGMVLSPLLANVYLHNLDLAVYKNAKGYIRYCDDFVILCKSQKEAEEMLNLSVQFLEGDLFLSINQEKTRVCNIKDGFTFLGFHFSEQGKKPAKKSLEKLKTKIESELRSTDKFTEEQIRERLKLIIRGWQNYFGFSSISTNELIKEIEEKSTLFRDSPAVNIFKSAVHILNSEYHKAYDLIIQQTDTQLQDEEIHIQKGLICEFLGLDEQAFDEYFQAMKIEPNNSETLYHLGRKLTEQGKIERAIKFLQKAVRLSPDRGEYYLALAKAYERWGLYGSARKALEYAKQINPDIELYSENKKFQDSDKAIDFKPTQEDIALFINLFSGREGVFAKQWINEYGKLGYSPVHKPIETEDVLKHFQGKITIGSYLLRRDNTVKFAVIDLDVNKKSLLEKKNLFSNVDLWSLLLIEAKKIQKMLYNFNIKSYLEMSGWKGIHVWIFFETPIKAEEVREFLKEVLKNTGLPNEGINREIFPAQSYIKEESFGSLIKLPLGIHQLTGKRCLFIDSDGNPVDNQIAFLWSIELVKRDTFKEAQTKIKRIHGLSLDIDSVDEIPEIKKLIEKCNVLRYLYIKANQENDLSHFERLTILNTIGHLGEQGRKAVHLIIGKCYNYKYDVTEKWINRISKNPASCPKIREWLSDITSVVGCYCNFQVDSQTYPSPVLHIGIKPLRRKVEDTQKTEVKIEQRNHIQCVNVEKLIEEYSKLRHEKLKLEQRILEIERELERISSTKDYDSINLKFGKLRKFQSEEGTKWIIEL